MGAEVNIKVENSSHLCDEWTGIVVCVVFSCLPHHHIEGYCLCKISCRLVVNGEEMTAVAGPRNMVGLSDHMWLFYLLPQYYLKEEDIKLLKDCEENEFSQIGIRIEAHGFGMGEKKCGFRMVYKKDIEDLNQIVAQSSNTSIIPYVDLGVLHHNLAVVAKGNKAKQTHDHYDGAGPSGEASSNELPHPQGNERFIEFMAHGDSDCEEYLECVEELSDWQKSSESDLEGWRNLKNRFKYSVSQWIFFIIVDGIWKWVQIPWKSMNSNEFLCFIGCSALSYFSFSFDLINLNFKI